ncbi:hypothetical protein [Comamonas aquatica]|uniref:hypothetical protein n=1 Tax=Comamonas aquatica TaxID=225991 RepID=UPI0034D3FAE0
MSRNEHFGFSYEVVLCDAQGNELSREIVRNLVPDEGLAYYQSAALVGGPQTTRWYYGLYTNNFTPVGSETAKLLPAMAVEFMGYEGEFRQEVAIQAQTNTVYGTGDSPLVLRATADATVYGGFISSARTKASTTGFLISVVRFDTPKLLSVGSTLTINVIQDITK